MLNINLLCIIINLLIWHQLYNKIDLSKFIDSIESLKSYQTVQEKLDIINIKIINTLENATIAYINGIIICYNYIQLHIHYFGSQNLILYKTYIIILILISPIVLVFKILITKKNRLKNQINNIFEILLIISRSGISYTTTLKIMTEDLNEHLPELYYELEILSRMLHYLNTEEQAWNNFAARIDCDDFYSTINTLIESDKLGINSQQNIADAIKRNKEKSFYKRKIKIERYKTLTIALAVCVAMPTVYITVFTQPLLSLNKGLIAKKNK